MRRGGPERVLDGTPVLLGAGGHFSYVSAHAIYIGAVVAVEALQNIQVFQPAPIKDDIVRAFHTGNSIDREAEDLVEQDDEVFQKEPQTTEIDDWRRQD